MPNRKTTSPAALSLAEEKFAQHYALHRNNRQAYLHAFPQARKWQIATVDSKASTLLATGKLQARLSVLLIHVQVTLEKRFEITAEKVLQELAAIAFAQPGDYFKWGTHEVTKTRKDGSQYVAKESYVTLTPSEELTEVQKRAVSSAEMSVSQSGIPVASIKLADKRGALKDLGLHLGLFNSKVQHTHTGKVTQLVEVREIVDVDDPKEALKIFEAYRRQAGAVAAITHVKH